MADLAAIVVEGTSTADPALIIKKHRDVPGYMAEKPKVSLVDTRTQLTYTFSEDMLMDITAGRERTSDAECVADVYNRLVAPRVVNMMGGWDEMVFQMGGCSPRTSRSLLFGTQKGLDLESCLAARAARDLFDQFRQFADDPLHTVTFSLRALEIVEEERVYDLLAADEGPAKREPLKPYFGNDGFAVDSVKEEQPDADKMAQRAAEAVARADPLSHVIVEFAYASERKETADAPQETITATLAFVDVALYRDALPTETEAKVSPVGQYLINALRSLRMQVVVEPSSTLLSLLHAKFIRNANRRCIMVPLSASSAEMDPAAAAASALVLKLISQLDEVKTAPITSEGGNPELRALLTQFDENVSLNKKRMDNLLRDVQLAVGSDHPKTKECAARASQLWSDVAELREVIAKAFSDDQEPDPKAAGEALIRKAERRIKHALETSGREFLALTKPK